ncbi:DUF4423 domain-containing protein [Bdellovibrio sp. HCB209]|uniref:DUF4423 domain-containing protein n=1 Tax=Bdellovibrio sp. HCB209 TaxID=3394354 RepID=UPI0039B5FE1B
MRNQFTTFRDVLLHDFNLKRLEIPGYSWRSYARSMNVSSGRMSEIMSGKKGLSEKAALKMSENLNLPTELITLFLELVAEHQHSKLLKMSTRSTATFLLDNWDGVALLVLMKSPSFKSEKSWIATKLGVSLERVTYLLDTLVAANQVTQDSEGNYRVLEVPIPFWNNLPVNRTVHSNIRCFEYFTDKLEFVETASAQATSLTVSIPLAKMDELKRLLADFHYGLKSLSDHSPESQISRLQVQLIPITVTAESSS